MDFKKTVLAIDDMTENLLVIKAIIADRYELCAAKSAAAGLNILARTAVDIVLLDLEMPVMSGFEFLEKMRENPDWASIPVILVTGTLPGTELEKRTAEAGASGCLIKPVDADIMLEKIAALLTERA